NFLASAAPAPFRRARGRFSVSASNFQKSCAPRRRPRIAVRARRFSLHPADAHRAAEAVRMRGRTWRAALSAMPPRRSRALRVEVDEQPVVVAVVVGALLI